MSRVVLKLSILPEFTPGFYEVPVAQSLCKCFVDYYLSFLSFASMSWMGAATWCQIKNGELVTVDSQSVTLMIEWYKDHDWIAHW
jgi:hypothetical protein